MRSILIFAEDEASQKALFEVYNKNVTALIETLHLPKKTQIGYDEKTSFYSFVLPGNTYMVMGPFAERTEKGSVRGIRISAENSLSGKGVGTEDEIEKRVRRLFTDAIRPYPASVCISFGISQTTDPEGSGTTKIAKPGKRFSAWLVTLLTIPVLIALMTVWYQIVVWFLNWFANKLPKVSKVLGFVDSTIGDAAGTGILGLLATAFVIMIVQAMVDASDKICQSRKGGRYLATGIIGIVLAVGLFLYYMFDQQRLTELLHLNWVVVLYVLYGLAVTSIMLIRSVTHRQ